MGQGGAEWEEVELRGSEQEETGLAGSGWEEMVTQKVVVWRACFGTVYPVSWLTPIPL